MRWSEEAVGELLQIVANADRFGVAMWIVDHVGTDEEAWDDLAITIGSMAATAFETVARAYLGADETAVYAPVVDDDLRPSERDAGLLVSMMMNGDVPGQLGVLTAARARGEFEAMLSALTLLAAGALRAESLVDGVAVNP